MRGLKATVLKLDFNYKLASKIRVWDGQGRSFKPYVCIITVLNEFAQTVFWKAYRTHESMGGEVIEDMHKLNHRLMRNARTNTSPILAVWSDKCCQWRKKLQEVFTNAEVKLDIFHWERRWDPLLLDTNSREAQLFRSLTRRALFFVDKEEYAAQKCRLREAKGREPLPKEIIARCRTMVFKPEELARNFRAVLQYCFLSD